MKILGDSSMSLQGRRVVIEEATAGQLVRGEAKVEAPPESILNKDGMKGGYKTASHSAP
jgi:hypothetical protein